MYRGTTHFSTTTGTHPRAVLVDVARLTEARYGSGSAPQQDVLKARVAVTELAQNANGLREQRQTQVASLNALIDRPSDASLESAHIPARLVRAALPDSDEHIHFASNVFGASVSDSLLPSLA
ncbi:MAG: hypothetical protein ACRENC_06300, partial [Gemmatimonadaceae bacterium]